MTSTIVMAQYGQPQFTVHCVRTVRQHHGDQVPIILVDDGSSAGDLEQVVAAGLPNVDLVRQPHRGVTAAWNAGAARATSDVVIFLNNDVVTTGPWVAGLTRLLENDKVVVAGVQRRRERHLRPAVLSELPTQVFAAGWCFAVRRSDFEAVHGFRNTLRLYFSDTDLQCRLLRRAGRSGAGMETIALPVRHLGHATTSVCPTRREQWQADRRRFHRLWNKVTPACSLRDDES